VVKRLPGLLIIFVLLFLTLSRNEFVNAQSGWALRINTLTTLETPNTLNLKVYFNIFDPTTGAAVTDAQISGAQIALLNTGLAAIGSIQQPDVPIYIALVLDSSGSMAGAAGLLKTAAKQALMNIPNNAFFSVIQFDEEIKLLQDFTENLPAVSYALDQVTVSTRGTCLYDAAYSAAEAMSKAPAGRRAVILFTDGKDETREGRVCSQHTYQELVELAMNTQVPIHTIGLSVDEANINTLELESMAASTGGFSAIAGQNNLDQAFEQIMAGLKAQWMVAAEVYPRQGENNAVMTLTMADNTSLTADFVFNSSQEYPGPPSPVNAQLDGLLLKPDDMTFDIQISLTSPELVNYVKISLWDEKAGSKTSEFVFESPALHNTFNIPSDQMSAGRDYQLRIIATSKADNVPFAIYRDSDGKTSTELIHNFNFDPSGFLPQLTIQSIIQSNNDLSVNIATSNSAMVREYDGWLVDEETKTVVPNSNFTSEAIAGGSGALLIPMEAADIADGKYTVVVRALGNDQQVFSTQEYAGIVYSATRPGVFQRVFSALTASPIYFFIILGIILALIAFLMLYSYREKSLSGTPVLQGRLGGGLKQRQKASTPLPLSEQEPLFQQKTPPINATPVPHQAPQMQSMSQTRNAASGEIAADVTQVVQNRSIVFIQIIRAPVELFSAGQRIPLNQFPLTIGRKDATLTFSDASISRLHAEIRYDKHSNQYSITDLESSNGTQLNGFTLRPRQPAQLQFGSRIQFGPNIEVVFDKL